MGWKTLFSKTKKADLNKAVSKTKTSLFSKIVKTIVGKSTVDDEVLDELEEVLISSDVGVDTTIKIIEGIEAHIERHKSLSTENLYDVLKAEITKLMVNKGETFQTITKKPNGEPYVMMVVGVNGVGKTTTIGKLANQFKNRGLKVVLGASDTFRAAAVDQLKVWAERVDVPIVQQGMGADPASVAFDAVESAKAQGTDVVIIDTAGRLHNKVNLMNELSKIKRVMNKVVESAPDEVLLVLDGSTGQNALEQARQFIQATEVNAFAMTKLDGTARGGVLLGICDQFKIPIKYIGVGEGIDHLQEFDKNEFVDSLFEGTSFSS